ncbi:hypothetical protein BS17DRAFT_779028 [Gyrodon lividus]|nr:hypothetical protein BS17DRAFT_779028 [Gyrodon lividus]
MTEVERSFALICGGCCLVVASTSNSLCSLRPFGFNRTCCSDQGCCGCCCKDSFDEERFDKQMQKEMERTRDKTVYTPTKPVDTEPGATGEMMVQGSCGTQTCQ